MLLFASRVVADNCCVLPIATVALEGETETDATGTGGGGGAGTVMLELPVLPSLVAVICVVPAATAVTRPDDELTEAMLELALDHDTTRPVRTLLFASRVVADNCCVAPIATVAVAGDTETVATGAGGGGAGAVTVIAAFPLWPSLDAVTVADPAATAVTTPDPETDATLAFELDHATTRPVNTLPLASRVVADRDVVFPT